MVRRADDFGNDSSIDVVNPADDTSTEALAAWIAELEGADDWIELPMTAAVLIDEDRARRAATASRLVDLLREQLERLVPAYWLEASVPSNHRTAISIRVVQSL